MNNPQGLLHHLFGGLTAFAQQHLAEHRLHQERLAKFREAIELAVDASEPRIRLVGNYAEKLLDAVESALHHAERSLQQLPPALALTPQAWAQNPQVNAFFATVADLQTMLAEDATIQKFCAESQASECFALMLMVKRESEAFGPVLNGDVVVRDVRRVQVSFSKHRLFFPAPSEKRLREELKQRILVFLATKALERINELRSTRAELEEQRRQLQAQLRAYRGHAGGLRPLLSTDDATHIAALERRLLDTEEKLVAARKPLETLDGYLEQIRLVLSQPQHYLQLRPLTLRLNRLGVKLAADATEPGETLALMELDSLGEQRIGTLVRFAVQDMPPAAHPFIQ